MSTATGEGFRLTMPGTDQALRPDDDTFVAESGQLFRCRDGIWDFVRPERTLLVDRFAEDYARVRAAEQRTPDTPAAVRALPYEDLSGQMEQMWAQRATSFDHLLTQLANHGAGPHSARRRTANMIDVGAGCGWLAARMTSVGWRAAAIDVTVTGGDGLDAARWHAEDLLLVRAEMEALPMADRSVDLVVFNASLHYAFDVTAALDEAARVAKPGAMIAVLDSPLFKDPAAGTAMVAEFAADVRQRLGIEPAAHFGPGFVTDADLRHFRERHQPRTWTRVDDRSGLIGGLRSALGARRAGREIARRPLVLATTSLEVAA